MSTIAKGIYIFNHKNGKEYQLKKIIAGIASGLLLVSASVMADSAKIYVSNSDNVIHIHDFNTGVEEGFLEVVNHNNPDPFGLFIPPASDELYSITASGWAMDQEFVVFDTKTNTEIRRGLISETSAAQQKLRYGAYSPSGDKIYFLSRYLANPGVYMPFQVFDTSSMLLTDSVDLGYDAESMLVSPDGTRLYVMGNTLSSYGIIKVLDATTLNVIDDTVASLGGALMAMSPAGDYMMVDHQGVLKAMDTTTLQFIPGAEIVQSHINTVAMDDTYIVVTHGSANVDVYNAGDYSLVSSNNLETSGWSMIMDADYDSELGKVSVSGFSMTPTVSGRVTTIDAATGTIEYDVTSGFISYDLVIKPATEDLSLLVKGVAANSVQCINNTTGQTVYITPAAGEQAWNCESNGLLVSPGDSVTVTAGGTAE